MMMSNMPYTEEDFHPDIYAHICEYMCGKVLYDWFMLQTNNKYYRSIFDLCEENVKQNFHLISSYVTNRCHRIVRMRKYILKICILYSVQDGFKTPVFSGLVATNHAHLIICHEISQIFGYSGPELKIKQISCEFVCYICVKNLQFLFYNN